MWKTLRNIGEGKTTDNKAKNFNYKEKARKTNRQKA